MHLKIKKSILQESFEKLSNITPKTTTEKITNFTFFEFENNNLSLITTNYELYLKIQIECETEGKVSICLNTYRLFNILKEFIGDTVYITVKEKNWILIECDNSEVKLPGIEKNLFPIIDFEELDKKVTISKKEIDNIIYYNLFSISENPLRKNINGLYVNFYQNNIIETISSDAYRVSNYNVELEHDIEDEKIIIPKKTLNLFSRIFTNNNIENIEISFNDRNIQFQVDNIIFKSSLLENSFPNLSRLLINSGNALLEIDRIMFLSKLRLFYTFVEDKNQSVKLIISNGKIFLYSERREFGQVDDSIEYTFYDGEEIEFGLNIRFVVEVLQILEKSKLDNVKFYINGDSKPLLIKADDIQNYKHINMPLKMKW